MSYRICLVCFSNYMRPSRVLQVNYREVRSYLHLTKSLMVLSMFTWLYLLAIIWNRICWFIYIINSYRVSKAFQYTFCIFSWTLNDFWFYFISSISWYTSSSPNISLDPSNLIFLFKTSSITLLYAQSNTPAPLRKVRFEFDFGELKLLTGSLLAKALLGVFCTTF